MMIREQIEKKIRAEFNPLYLDVVDESDRHNVPMSYESHFKVILVSDRFNDECILNRHRAVYGVLEEELAGIVHALALHTYTVREWKELHDIVPDSPPCRGTGPMVY
ncbi:MAG: DNA-binding transcriptional dual regulator BolA [Sodalis sp. Psp]|nr:DNA-binding transcriptional dual regulator BolA [Sodalis sp. Psp]MCR3756931.1 DNA-binding transcriptional dual regulator BolA [Sodalis sp. Ppy]